MAKIIASNIWYVLLVIGLWSYFIYTYLGVFNRLFKGIALSSKRPKHERLRRFYWLKAKLDIRVAIMEYCHYLTKHGSTVQCIMMYELDAGEYKASYIMCGYDRLYLDVITKMEEIHQFVIDWRKADKILDTTEMLTLYLNETKPVQS